MPKIVAIKYKLINLAMIGGQPLSRWIKGVSVILEKLISNVGIQKLRATLLLEADFNTLHKIMFNNRLIPTLEVGKAMLIEVKGRRRSKAATHLVLSKTLIANASIVRKLLAVTICADAANCYDRVAHSFASLCTQYFRLEILCLVVLFRIIQSMKTFLRTSHRVSDSHYLGDKDKPFQGVV